MKDAFYYCHPIAIIAQFTAVMLFSMILMHPACLLISLGCSAAYYVRLKGWHESRPAIVFMLPALLVTALVNPAFNHEGATILGYLPGGNPLTLESILLGAAAALTLVTMLAWFACLSMIMSADKMVYLFGRLSPSLALILSMALGFVPAFRNRARIIAAAQKGVGRDPEQGSAMERIRRSATIISMLTTWALENAIDTADSMKSRGFGLKGRSTYAPFRLDSRDRSLLGLNLVLCLFIGTGTWQGLLYCQYTPLWQMAPAGPWQFSLLSAYLALCALPLCLSLWEEKKWQLIQSKV